MKGDPDASACMRLTLNTNRLNLLSLDENLTDRAFLKVLMHTFEYI